MFIPARPASKPSGLPEWDERWSRLVTVDTHDGEHTFHVLDTLPALTELGLEPTGTILALHGNPTWSYLWRRLAGTTVEQAAAAAGQGADTQQRIWRVIAPDQLEMGFSDRLEHHILPTPLGTEDPSYRRIATRVTDFNALTQALCAEVPATSSPAHPLVTLGHDWGGVLSLTWAARNMDKVAAVMTLNTAVWHDYGEKIPAALRAALSGPVLPLSTVRTDAFLRTSVALSHSITPELTKAYTAPYGTAADRGGVGAFVADIPASAEHPSYPELQALSADIEHINTPALIVWGPKDPVFQERYLRDLRHRLPQADVHRFEGTSHLFVEDAPYDQVITHWLDQHFPAGTPVKVGTSLPARDTLQPNLATTLEATPETGAGQRVPMIYEALRQRHTDRTQASFDMSKSPAQGVSWAQLSHVVDNVAASLQNLGLKHGDRVSLLVTPGNNLTAAAYAVLKAGGVAVVADAGLGLAGMTRAVKAADPAWIIGETKGLALARSAGWPGRRISVSPLNKLAKKTLGVETSLTEMSRRVVRDPEAQIHTPSLDDDAAILFTSGSTGPAKGVRYTHRALGALAQTLRTQFGVSTTTGLVAGFAPFALLGPGIGATSVTPKMSVTKPRTLSASALADAVAAGECTMVFASPAAYRNVVKTAGNLSAAQREACQQVELALSAGAPVPLELMEQIRTVFPNAKVHSPYGMTEGLLLTDITDTEVAQAAATKHSGVCVGRPIAGVSVALAPLDDSGQASDDIVEGTAAHNRLGEFVVSAPHIKSGYDNLWETDAQSKRDSDAGRTWHRTNDVGHIDEHGRIWIEGRLQHVISTVSGPVAPGGLEAIVDGLTPVSRSAVVGIGPARTQVLAVVLEKTRELHPGLAPLELTEQIRARVLQRFGHDIAAVLVAPDFPTDIRHNSKIDREKLRQWAEGALSQGKVAPTGARS